MIVKCQKSNKTMYSFYMDLFKPKPEPKIGEKYNLREELTEKEKEDIIKNCNVKNKNKGLTVFAQKYNVDEYLIYSTLVDAGKIKLQLFSLSKEYSKQT